MTKREIIIFWLTVAVVPAITIQSAHGHENLQVPAYAEPADESSQYLVETVTNGLDNPCGLAVRPGETPSGAVELFFSESGAGRIVRVNTGNLSEPAPVLTGFPLGEFGVKRAYRVGPLGLEFITRSKLAVGTGGLGKGADLVRVYELPEDGAPLEYDKVDHSVGPILPSPRSAEGEGQYFALAKIDHEIESALFATSVGDENQGWILKADLKGNHLSDLQPFVAARRLLNAGMPMAVTVNPKPRSHYLLVGQAGEPGDKRDSVLSYLGPASGAVALSVNTGLYDISGLAYSSPSGDLYAVDFAWADPKAGGVYRLEAAEVDGQESCRAVKIAAVERPTSLTFTPDGTLYVTAFGDNVDGEVSPSGKLIRITPGEGTPKL